MSRNGQAIHLGYTAVVHCVVGCRFYRLTRNAQSFIDADILSLGDCLVMFRRDHLEGLV